MTQPKAAHAFLLSEIEHLEPFDFVAIVPSGAPMRAMEVTRLEDGRLEVRAPGRPMLLPPLAAEVQKALADQGFKSSDADDRAEPWARNAPDAESAAKAVQEILVSVFEAKPDAHLDFGHGSHRAEHEARAKLTIARSRIEALVAEMLGHAAEQDDDGDYVLPIGDVHVMVSPRVVMTGQVVVRVFAITNVGVQVSPELGLFLARLNFGLTFGRFALDAEHASIWFDEAILGEEFREEELRFAIQMVSSTADEWDDRLKQMFGGATHQEVLAGRSDKKGPTLKPGEGGGGQYL